ncbi:DNA adenine methylase [Clostridium botulinum]|nr:DNA adenine methylase [Clostridium botulinum]MBO0555307.1 DNA adenine methylase [Clostridium botulinum]
MKLKHISNIKWIGGKHGKEEKYLDLMPEHKILVDCFFGSGAIPFYKETVNPAKLTVVNDINDRLINYMMVLKEDPERLYKECSSLPYSESLFEKWKWEAWPEDNLQAAVRFYYLMRVCFGGGGHKYRNGIGLSKTQNKANQLVTATELIPKMAELIKEWNILNRDFEEVIKFYDTEETLFFLDPPYHKHEDMYFGGFEEKDHIRLKKRLDKIKGKAMVCYYSSPLIDELYKDWHIVEYSTASQIKNRTNGEKCPVRNELILMNYKPIGFEQLSIV